MVPVPLSLLQALENVHAPELVPPADAFEISPPSETQMGDSSSFFSCSISDFWVQTEIRLDMAAKFAAGIRARNFPQSTLVGLNLARLSIWLDECVASCPFVKLRFPEYARRLAA